MTRDEMDALKPGDLIRHMHSNEALLVHSNLGGKVTAVRVTDASNPGEWDQVDRHGRVISSDAAYPKGNVAVPPARAEGAPRPSLPCR